MSAESMGITGDDRAVSVAAPVTTISLHVKERVRRGKDHKILDRSFDVFTDDGVFCRLDPPGPIVMIHSPMTTAQAIRIVYAHLAHRGNLMAVIRDAGQSSEAKLALDDESMHEVEKFLEGASDALASLVLDRTLRITISELGQVLTNVPTLTSDWKYLSGRHEGCIVSVAEPWDATPYWPAVLEALPPTNRYGAAFTEALRDKFDQITPEILLSSG